MRDYPERDLFRFDGPQMREQHYSHGSDEHDRRGRKERDHRQRGECVSERPQTSGRKDALYGLGIKRRPESE